LAAAAASEKGNPLAFAFPARHNLSYALRAVSLIVADALFEQEARSAWPDLTIISPIKTGVFDIATL